MHPIKVQCSQSTVGEQQALLLIIDYNLELRHNVLLNNAYNMSSGKTCVTRSYYARSTPSAWITKTYGCRNKT